MDAELDLRPYIAALVRRWRLIVGAAVLGLVAAGVLSLLLPVQPSATGTVLIVPSSTQLAFDPRFTTRDATQITNAAFQRQALIGLASSPSLEALVLAKLPPELAATYIYPTDLLSAVEVTSEGDLLRITARALTVEDAQLIAETWSQTYQELVNTSYSGGVVGVEQLQSQLDAAATRYSEAQAQLERFVGESRLNEIEMELSSIGGLLNSAMQADRLLYTQLLTRTRELDVILSDAAILRDQVGAGNLDAGSAMASLMLRARAAGGEQLPVTVRVENPTDPGWAVTAAELDAFIASVQARRDELLAETHQIAATIAGDGSTGYALPPEQRAQYEQRLRTLNREREAEIGRRNALQQQSAIALSSLEVLRRRAEEQFAAQSAPEAAVRFIGVAQDPPASRVRRGVILGGLGMVAALGAAVLFVLIRELLGARGAGADRFARAPSTQGDRQVERPVGD